MSKKITIAGRSLEVPQPFATGHVCSENEASTLNQTFAENLRNNLADKVEEAVNAGKTDEQIQAEVVNPYAAEYKFGKGGGGGVRVDPVLKEARALAKVALEQYLTKAGHEISSFTKEDMAGLIQQTLDKNPIFMKEAEKTIKARQKVAATELSDLDIGAAKAA